MHSCFWLKSTASKRWLFCYIVSLECTLCPICGQVARSWSCPMRICLWWASLAPEKWHTGSSSQSRRDDVLCTSFSMYRINRPVLLEVLYLPQAKCLWEDSQLSRSCLPFLKQLARLQATKYSHQGILCAVQQTSFKRTFMATPRCFILWGKGTELGNIIFWTTIPRTLYSTVGWWRRRRILEFIVQKWPSLSSGMDKMAPSCIPWV